VSRPLPLRLRRLAVPERAPLTGCSLAEAERRYQIFAEGEDLLNLTYADTKRFPAPSWAAEDFLAAARGGGEAYTPYRGDLGVREAVAPSVSAFLGVEVDPATELALTPGTQAGLFEALTTIVEEGDRVLLVDPDYLCNERILRFLGAEVDHVPLRYGAEGAALDLEHVEQGLRGGARLLVFSHPNNPTGAVYDAATVDRLAALLVEHDALALVDQLYARLVFDRAAFHHLVARPGMKERCVTLLGPSKTESMSGYRIGVLAAPSAIVDAVEDLQAVTAIRAPAYAQHTLVRWLRDDHEFVAQRIADYQALRDRTAQRLGALDFVELHRPQGTAYVFPRVLGLGSDHEVAEALLAEARVIINPGFQFGPRGVGSFRLCFAQDEQVWDRALERIVGALERLAARRPRSGPDGTTAVDVSAQGSGSRR
jgi:aspartate/methionine/tyrosine aminotransferase